ncbi:hypothetical protein PH5382_03281 [Phaeobacter sp. CECT 5382]|uniref:DUF7933 domain-containing protein n=1 Tax=Phaeobacter sp. CECT 5382 TaxID=1712645 RepID=UPI0006DA14E4|nr:Ig-like domain-containing protein [Phaeobacter sp. CECT 5382]CUH89335.1 hypothetical protein PH5382_03281 [Phaeobacter sp. CECT 5382]
MTSLLRRFSHLFLAILLVMLPGLALASPSGPPWTMAFSPDAIGIGNESRLTFTIDNSSSSAPVDDLAFSGTLPTGLVISSGAQSDSCSGTLTASAGGSSISYSNGRISLGASCTISLMVTSNASAPYTFTTGDLTSSFGNSGAASANLSVDATRTGFGKSFSPSSQNPGSITTLTYTLDNSANPSFASLRFSEVLPAGLELATPANISNSCGGTVTASSGGSSISASSIFLAAGATCTVSVDVKALTSGDYALTNELISSPTIGEATATLTVNSPPSGGIGFFKSFDVAQAAAGETVTLNFALSNTSRTGAATNIAFTDDLNAMLSGLTATALPADGFCGVGSTMSGSSSLTVSGASLASAASCNFDVSVLIPVSAATGSYTNSTSSLSADLDGSAYTGSAASTTLQVLGDGGQGAHLSKSFTDDPVVPGNTVTARYTLTNPNAAVAISGITFQDTISAVSGATISTLPASGSCGGSSAFNVIDPNGLGENVFLLSGGALAAGASCNFDVVINIPSSLTPGSYPTSTTDVTTTVAASSVTTPGASDILTVAGGADLSFHKEFSDEIIGAGGTTTLTFTLTSSAESPSTATGLAFSDDIDAFLTGATLGINSNTCGGSAGLYVGNSRLDYTGGTLDPGDSCTVVTTVSIPDAATATLGAHTNTTSTLTGTAGGEALVVPAASDTLTVQSALPMVTTKSFSPSTALPGETVTLTYTLTNPDTIRGYTNGTLFTDNYSSVLSGLAIVPASLPAGGFCGGSSTASGTTSGTFNNLSIPASSSCSFSVQLLVPGGAADGDYSSASSTITSTLSDASFVTLPAIVANFSVDAAQVQLTKAYGTDPVGPGDTVSVNYTLINLSSSKALTAIAFSDDLDTQLAGLASTSGAQSNLCGAGSSLSGTGTLSFVGGSLAAGASCSFSATLQVPGGSTASIYSGTTSTVSADASGLTVTGPAVASTLTVSAFELPSFAKSFADPALGPGGSTTLTYVITNNDSTTTLNGLRFTDDLDAALTGLAVTAGTGSNLCGTGSVIAGSGEVTLTGGTLAPGQSCSIPLTVTTPASATDGSYPSSSSTLTESGEFAASAASATLTIDPAPLFSKAFAASSVTRDSSTTLTFTIDNSAASIAATGLDFTDNLPAGLTVASTPSASTTCSGGTLTAAAGAASISYTGGSIAGANSCSLSVDVTAGASGSLVNTSGDLTSSLGNSGPAMATLKVPSLSFDSPLLGDDIANSAEAAAATISGSTALIEDGQSVSVVVTDSASATASGTATVSGNAWSLTLNLSTLADGALTLTADVADAAGTPTPQASASLSLDTDKPSLAFDSPLATDGIVSAAEAAAVTISGSSSGIEDGQSVSVVVTDSASATASGSATVSGNAWSLTLNLSALANGALTLTADATNSVGNPVDQISTTLTQDQTAPAGYSATFDQDPIITSTETAVSFTFAGAETGAQYDYTIASDGGGADVTGNGTIATASDQITGIDISGLGDGTLTLSVVLTDAAGQAGSTATDTSTKDTARPTVTLAGPTEAQSGAFTVTLTFSESVTGLAQSDLSLVDGTASGLSGSGTSYSVTVTPDHDGTVIITLPEDSAINGGGNGNLVSAALEIIADLTGTPNPTPPADADGDGVPDNLESSTADRDGDGIPDAADYDPQGYFYCEDDGRILSGGGITVTGPSGSNSSVGISNNINIVRDGSTGEYQWFALVPGTYSVAYSYPAGGIASTARLSSGSLDVTSLLPANPAVIGSTEVGSTGVLADASLAANPAFYDSFVIEAGDPNVLANNIPMTQCAQIEVSVSATDTGAEANGATTDSASFTISQTLVTAQDTVLSYTLGGTATSGTDFTAPTGSITILAGDTSALVDLPVLEDGLIEGSETVTLTLTAVTSASPGVILSATTADLTGSTSIADDDFAVVAVSNDDLTASESGNDTAAMSFTLLGQPSQTVQLAFSGDAQCSVSPAVLNFTSANYASAQTLTITAIDDELVEGSHSCQPTVAVTSADTAFDGFVLALASVTVTDDLVDQIREPLTQILKNDLEETVKTQQRYFSDMSKGALSRLRAGAEGLGCGTLAGFDIDGTVNITGGEGQTDGSFGYDVYNCHSGSREILDGAFSLTRTENIGTQALLQFSRQRERFLSETDLRGNFLGGYLSRTNVTGLADGAITGMGVNGGIYGARELSDGVFLDYYAAGAFGHHRYDLDFAATPSVIRAEGSYDYAAAFAGAALSGQHQMDTLLVTPRVGVDLAYALASDADVTATQLAQSDTGRIDIPDYNGGRLFAEIEFSGFGSNTDPTNPNAISSRMALAPRLACESSSYDTSSSSGCGFGLSFSREIFNPLTGLSYSFEIDYEMIDETDRVTVDFHRERRFADDRGAVVTRLSMPTSDSLKIEHGVRLDF